jgi:5-formyltetrahydrofolate cyclo-ligase
VLTPEIEAAVRARAKAELRRRVRAVRAKLPPEARAARSAAVVERLRALPSYQAANCVALYVALRSEVDLGPLLADAASCGKRVALPRVEAGDRALALHAYLPGDPLEPSAFGVLEPRPSAPRIDPADVALVVVPGLVFDERGHRVGYGAGYYDRLLPTLDRAARVGVAFDFQLVAEVPDTAGDVPVDVVVTDRRVVSARREAP